MAEVLKCDWRFGLALRFKDTAARQLFARKRGLQSEDWRVVNGDCMRPYLVTGDVVMVDLEREPVDGDLVLVAMRYRRSCVMIGDLDDTTSMREAVKQFRVIDGEPYLAAADGKVHANCHEVMGVIVAWRRIGWWRRPSLKKMTLSSL